MRDEGENSVSTMKKDDLSAYALAEHGVELDLTKPIKDLREYVASMDDKKAKKQGQTQDDEEKEVPLSTHLKHPVNGRVYEATPALRARKDMLPCNAKGKAV